MGKVEMDVFASWVIWQKEQKLVCHKQDDNKFRQNRSNDNEKEPIYWPCHAK